MVADILDPCISRPMEMSKSRCLRKHRRLPEGLKDVRAEDGNVVPIFRRLSSSLGPRESRTAEEGVQALIEVLKILAALGSEHSSLIQVRGKVSWGRNNESFDQMHMGRLNAGKRHALVCKGSARRRAAVPRPPGFQLALLSCSGKYGNCASLMHVPRLRF